ncbi:MAG: hypothetical protein ACYC3X_25405 [Pirellulaceae bacterium]
MQFFSLHQSYLTHPSYKDAHAAIQDLPPITDDTKLKLAIEYAKAKYQEYGETFDALDEKADSLLRLTSGGGVAFAVAMKIAEITPTWPLLTSLVLVILSAVFALIARFPVSKASTPEIMDVIEDLKEYDAKRLSGHFPASYHCAVVGLRIANDRKAAHVFLSSLCLCAALVSVVPAFACRPQKFDGNDVQTVNTDAKETPAKPGER